MHRKELSQALSALVVLQDRLPFAQTIIDIEIFSRIALLQLAGKECTVKALQASLPRPARTIHRRLERLKKLGIVEQIESDGDRRRKAIVVNASVLRTILGDTPRPVDAR